MSRCIPTIGYGITTKEISMSFVSQRKVREKADSSAPRHSPEKNQALGCPGNIYIKYP